MRAHEFISEQWDAGGGAWNPTKARIDIIGLGHLILMGTVGVGVDGIDSIKAVTKVGLTDPELHAELKRFYEKTKDPKRDAIPVIKQWLQKNKPKVAGELHDDFWEGENWISSKMFSNGAHTKESK
jgi:hypothetical protein